jgi:hypothetical protein
MATRIYTGKECWRRLAAAAKDQRGDVAVAYVGQRSSNLLPLKAGSRLVVDATEEAVREGKTDPKVLRAIKRRGVRVYSRRGLHAKVFVLGRTAFVGSTNLSARSAEKLIEALVEVREPAAVSALRSFVDSLCLVPLTEQALEQLVGIYRPPKKLGAAARKRRRSLEDSNKIVPALKVVQLEPLDATVKQEREGEAGEGAARQSRQHSRRMDLDRFQANERLGNKLKPGEWLLQVVETRDNRVLVHEPTRIVHKRRFLDGGRVQYWIYFDERRGSRRRPVKRLVQRYGRGGKALFGGEPLIRNAETLERVFALFKEARPAK